MSPRRLDLRIFCESGAPIGSILGSWPTLPLVIRYSARSQESTRMPKNVAVALRRPDRIYEINLDVTRSMTGPIVEMVSKPCQVLERIRITVKDATRPSIIIRDAFLRGSAPHLREIELDGISFPFLEIRRVLLSTNNLIELHLSNITRAPCFSPDDPVTSLSTLVQLKSLTVGFHSPYFSPPFSTTRRPHQSTTLSSLESFYFHGTSDYLEGLVSQIDLPALRHITLRLFMLIYLEPPQFNQFIPHQNVLQSPTRLRISHSVELVSISFFLEAGHTSRICSFETSCPRLEPQLLFAAQILGFLSPLLSTVDCVTIEANGELPTGEEHMNATQWLELFQSLTHVKEIRVMEAQLVPSVVEALALEEMDPEVLPELGHLFCDFPNCPFMLNAAEQ